MQIQMRSQAEGQIKQEQIDHENQVNQQTQVGLEILKEKQKKEKDMEKVKMQQELHRIQMLKKQKVALG